MNRKIEKGGTFSREGQTMFDSTEVNTVINGTFYSVRMSSSCASRSSASRSGEKNRSHCRVPCGNPKGVNTPCHPRMPRCRHARR